MNQLLQKLLVICLLLWLPTAFAAKVADLYTGIVPVNSQSKAALKKALPQALAQVFVKVSGDPQVVTDDAVTQSLKRAADILSSYRYIDQTMVQDAQQLLLQAQFEPSEVVKLLQNAHQPVWGENRPLVLVWLAVQGQGRVSLLTTDSPNPLAHVLVAAAKMRGLPIVLPMGDMTDMNQLRAKDVADFDVDKITAASARYQADTVLIGFVKQLSDDRWQARWQVLGPEPVQDQQDANSANAAIKAGIDWLTDNLAQHYAVKVNADSTALLTVHIGSIDGLDDYADVVKYLNGLTPVQKVETEDLSSGHVVLKLHVLGGETALLRAISAEKKLTEAQATIPPAEGQPEILYLRWQ